LRRFAVLQLLVLEFWCFVGEVVGGERVVVVSELVAERSLALGQQLQQGVFVGLVGLLGSWT
jgi:hypothetical protein